MCFDAAVSVDWDACCAVVDGFGAVGGGWRAGEECGARGFGVLDGGGGSCGGEGLRLLA